MLSPTLKNTLRYNDPGVPFPLTCVSRVDGRKIAGGGRAQVHEVAVNRGAEVAARQVAVDGVLGHPAATSEKKRATSGE